MVVGNPPFLNQLESATANDRAVAALIRAHLGESVQRYADLAAAFMLLAVSITRPDGRASLVLPQSFLTAHDSANLNRNNNKIF